MTKRTEGRTLRLNLFLARTGIASRRGAEELIGEGRITLNGKKVTKLATVVDPASDTVRVDGDRVSINVRKEYHVLYKPREVVSTMKDPEGRNCLASFLPRGSRGLFPVGRLDYHSEGLLLLTNDGDLSNRLLHPRYKVEKVYTLKVKGLPAKEEIDRLRRGIRLEGRKTLPMKIRRLPSRETKHTWLEVKMTEGRKNQLREMFFRIRHPVIKLKRTAVGPVKIGRLRPGEVRTLTPAEASELLEHAGLKKSGKHGKGLKNVKKEVLK